MKEKLAKVAVNDIGEENGKESAAVHVDSDAIEDEDNVVVIATATHNRSILSEHRGINVAQEGRDNYVCCILACALCLHYIRNPPHLWLELFKDI